MITEQKKVRKKHKEIVRRANSNFLQVKTNPHSRHLKKLRALYPGCEIDLPWWREHVRQLRRFQKDPEVAVLMEDCLYDDTTLDSSMLITQYGVDPIWAKWISDLLKENAAVGGMFDVLSPFKMSFLEATRFRWPSCPYSSFTMPAEDFTNVTLETSKEGK